MGRKALSVGSLLLLAAYYAASVHAQDYPNDTCETATRIEIPFFESETNEGARTAGLSDPAFACPRFDSESAPIVFYELIGDGSCSCVELRGNNAFIMGVYQSSCDSLECIADSDFTSESIIWRTSQAESYRIAVSVLPSGPPLGTFSL